MFSFSFHRANYPEAHGATSLSFAGGVTNLRSKWVVIGQEGGTMVRGQSSRLIPGASVGVSGSNEVCLRHK